ncbi:hypothetical protein NHQ30_005071 [Ciborinia camelliae]|nr:hypothetical protein NHQ30_005071 [Ciborinia camelliae]
MKLANSQTMGPPRYTRIHTNSDSYSFIVEKAIENERALEQETAGYEKAVEYEERAVEYREEISTQCNNMIEWYTKVRAKPYLQAFGILGICISASYVTLLGITYCLGSSGFKYGFKGFMFEFKGGVSFHWNASSVAQCYETYKEHDITAAIILLVIGLIYLLFWVEMEKNSLHREIAQMKGRLEKYEGHLNTEVESDFQRKDFAEKNSHLGSIEAMLL